MPLPSAAPETSPKIAAQTLPKMPPADDVRAAFLHRRIAENAEIAGDLSLIGVHMRALPNGLAVRGNLDLRACNRLRHIGERLKVNGDLLLGNSPLRRLPQRLSVGKRLRVYDCPELEEIADDIQVGSDIVISGCRKLTRLPRRLEVHGDFTFIANRECRELPAELIVHGTLTISGSLISRLPHVLTIDKSLKLLCCTRLSELPEHLIVGEHLHIARCPIEHLSPQWRVGKTIHIRRCTKLTATPDGLTAPVSIKIFDCTNLVRMGGVQIGKNLSIVRCRKLQELPANQNIPGILNLSDCTGLTRLPCGMRIGDTLTALEWVAALRLGGCRALASLPDDLIVGSSVEVAGSGLQDMPAALRDKIRLLWRGVRVTTDMVFHPERITPVQVFTQQNAELRRVMIERAGLDNLIRKAKTHTLDQDTDAGGERRLIRIVTDDHVRVRVFLVCRCPSSGRQYLMRVPPTTTTCQQAAAWLAGFDRAEEYKPVQET